MGNVFISYRRQTAADAARTLFNDLLARLGKSAIIMDVDGVARGRDFRTVLQMMLTVCDVMLVVIDKDWAALKDENGRNRLDSEGDFVRMEIAAALRRDIVVTPVLVNGARMPAAEELPQEIRDLAYRKGFELSHDRWESDIADMIGRLGLVPGDRRYREPDRQPGPERRDGSAAAGGVPRQAREHIPPPAAAAGPGDDHRGGGESRVPADLERFREAAKADANRGGNPEDRVGATFGVPAARTIVVPGFQSPGWALARLQHMPEGRAAPATGETRWRRAAAGLRSRRTSLVIAGVAGAACLGGVVWFAMPRPPPTYELASSPPRKSSGQPAAATAAAEMAASGVATKAEKAQIIMAAPGAQTDRAIDDGSGSGGQATVDRDVVRLFRDAADRGDTNAQNWLATFYRDGRGGFPKDDREAARLFKLAADKGDPFAQYNLGVFYEYGRGGMPKDAHEAARFYKLAADQGYAPAQAALTILLKQSLPTTIPLSPDLVPR